MVEDSPLRQRVNQIMEDAADVVVRQLFREFASPTQQALNYASRILSSKTETGKQRLPSPVDLGKVVKLMGEDDEIPDNVRLYLGDLLEGNRPKHGTVKIFPNFENLEKDIQILFDYLDVISGDNPPSAFHTKEEYLVKKYAVSKARVYRVLKKHKASIDKFLKMSEDERTILLTIMRTLLSLQESEDRPIEDLPFLSTLLRLI